MTWRPHIVLANRPPNTIQKDLAAHGAVVLRGLEWSTPEGFRQHVQALLGDLRSPYGGVGVKRALAPGVYAADELPARYEILPHQELAYLPHPPRWMALGCLQPPDTGGETTLARATDLTADLSPEVRDELTERGLRITRRYRSPRAWHRALNAIRRVITTWDLVFETSDRGQVSRIATEHGLTVTWERPGDLTLTTPLAALRPHPRTGEAQWFHQAHLYCPSRAYQGWSGALAYRLVQRIPLMGFPRITYGDGTSLPRTTVDHLVEVSRAHRVPHVWERGDLLLLRLDRPCDAVSAFALAQELSKNSALAGDSLAYRARALDACGETKAARAHAEAYLERYPSGVSAKAMEHLAGGAE